MQFAVSKSQQKPCQLAITKAGLLAEGVRPARVEATWAQLCRAVKSDPSLNTYPTLAHLARQMQRYLGKKPLWIRALQRLDARRSGCARSQTKKQGS